MDQVKKFSTYDELLNKLRDRGCIINNASACIEVLKNIGYYRLSAYFYPFMQEDKTFVEKLSFDKVYRIYEFDRKLRNLLLTALEVIEISLRARLAHFHSEKYGPQGYLNASNFNKKHQSAVFTGKINIAISNNKRLRLSGIILKSMTGISPCGLSPSCSHSVCFHVFTVTLRRQIKKLLQVSIISIWSVG